MIPREKQRERKSLRVRERRNKRRKSPMVRKKRDCQNQPRVKRSNGLGQERLTDGPEGPEEAIRPGSLS